MDWLRLPLALVLILLCSFGTAFLGSAWERRRKRNDAVDDLLALLPGYDCGLCGEEDCRHFARRIWENGGDPGLCGPGGSAVERKIRASLQDERATARIALVRCGAAKKSCADLFVYDGREDCMVAARHFEGPKECSSACLGLGSCVRSCPVSAIRVVDGLARVDPQRCTGCGKCVASCPKGLITLVPSSSQWYVACNSQCLPEEKGKHCSVACTACGECSRLSTSWEFSQRENLAYASQSIPADGPGAGAWASIAARCPTGAIVRSGFENQTKNEQQEVEKKN